MPGAQPRQSQPRRQGSSVVRGTSARGPGAYRVGRPAGGGSPVGSVGDSEFSDANTLFVRWSGTLDAGDIIRTQDATPDTTDFGSTSILAYSAPGPVTPTVAALLYVGWELILDGPAASPWGAVAFYPSTNTSGDFSDHGESSTSHQTYATIALAADHLIQAQLANLGGVDGVAYTITLRVQPIILL